MTAERFTATNNIECFMQMKIHQHTSIANRSSTQPVRNLASTDIADVALTKIVDHPTCGHRMAIIVTFRTKHKTPTMKPQYIGI